MSEQPDLTFTVDGLGYYKSMTLSVYAARMLRAAMRGQRNKARLEGDAKGVKNLTRHIAKISELLDAIDTGRPTK